MASLSPGEPAVARAIRDLHDAMLVRDEMAAALFDSPADVRDALDAGAAPDYITLGGSGEPTLHAGLGEVARRVKRLSDIPVALLTNGALFFRPDARQDAARADVVLPSLDAPNAELFARINRPHESLRFERYVDGLAQFREEYTGQIWLEVVTSDTGCGVIIEDGEVINQE